MTPADIDEGHAAIKKMGYAVASVALLRESFAREDQAAFTLMVINCVSEILSSVEALQVIERAKSGR